MTTTSTTTTPPRTELRDFYENPAVPVASGTPRTLRQARLLATALGPSTGPSGRTRTILDIGCGDGTAAATTAPLLPGHRIIGVDWSQDALKRAHTRIPYTLRAELNSLPFRDSSADAVLFSEVIEHLVDPDAALDEIRRVLRPGGHLMLSTPNLAAWYNRALLLAGVQPVFSEVSLRAIHGRPGREVVGHLRLYTARALREYVTTAGFEVVRLKGAPFHGVPRPLRPLDRLACSRAPLASILLLHARRT
ncbi:methyltransferase domain-containing protein [Streptomyces sp. DG2A-72]|uniref:class I SAM-dependent methyltransferase n=1 Tax=Streptomyces sp. DG2A-72 TaxID=3051386 RepID=UPI00265C3BD7|nr:class I SAM-dependent methyltransferase [Streptomyces sp. DG2A-72]MDO0932856.1 methyltransferase domain-containing protein [Streptomyces sp. DG2A-72]